MNTDFTIRIAQQSDALELMSLFQETVLHINKRDYSEAEVADWASCGNDLSHIKDMIKTHYFIVATNQQSQIVGFSSITHQGYLHSMFIHKDFQGKGIATILLNEIERYATARGIMRITSEVSLTARPFFEKRGYIVEVEQKRKANQLYLTNFWMAKRLTDVFLLVVSFVVVVPYTQEKKVPAKEQNRMVLAVKNVKHSIYVAWKKE